jgi:hypothetical protein
MFLSVSAVAYLLAALALLFAADEILRFALGAASQLDVALLQLIGAALFGFAMLNWLNRYSLVGGIFSRPLVMANLAHTATAALMLGHLAVRQPVSPWLAGAALAYAALAVGFGSKLVLPPPSSQAL